jgi:hypothetical protein
VQNQVIEIHDSALDRITLEGGMAVLYFPEVYIHLSEGRPAIDAGTGWTQEAVIRIGSAELRASFPKRAAKRTAVMRITSLMARSRSMAQFPTT